MKGLAAQGVTVHPAASSVDALTYLANQGTIEFHVPLGTCHDAFQQEYLVFDFDPPEGGTARAREAAWACKALLDELGVDSTPLATGSKGFHVYARLMPTEPITQTTHKLAAILVHRYPALLTHEFLKENRGGRVLVDWMRNAGLATVIAPWSLRARPGAPVATPIAWNELDRVEPNTFGRGDVFERTDYVLALSPADPKEVTAATDQMFQEAGIELTYIDRFGRRR